MGQIKTKVNGKDRTVGIKVKAQIVKNRMGNTFEEIDFEIYFERGIDNYGSWLGVMKENKLLKQRPLLGIPIQISKLVRLLNSNQKNLFL